MILAQTGNAGGYARVTAGVLDVAYLAQGPENGRPVVLLHGFPYSPHAYDATATLLAARGFRTIAPYLRGYGPTRFLDPETPRSGEQAVLGADLKALIDALALDRPLIVGFDWGGRAACICAALWPERIGGLVTIAGYNIFPDHDPSVILPPRIEHILWYQYYMHRPDAHERLAATRDTFCRYLWTLWSPSWGFSDATFVESAAAFDNPDFVDVVIHSYRHRFGLAPGDPSVAEIASRAARLPPITVPTIVLHGDQELVPPDPSRDRNRFTGQFSYEVAPGVGHNLPQEAPELLARAICKLAAR